MGRIDQLSDGGAEQICPWCDTPLIGGAEGGWGEGRFECPDCTGGVFFIEDGVLVDSMHRGGGGGGRRSESCDSSLSGGQRYLPYENGSNSNAYIKCPSCGHENVRYGFGDDND